MFNDAAHIDPNKVACYIRWSTDEQSHGTTLDVQRDSCRKFLDYKGWNFRDELVFIDDGYSGGNLKRPAMTALRQAVQDGRVACVVVYKLDRLSRNLYDTVTLVRGEWSEKCTLYSTQEDFNTNNAVGQMLFNILASFAEFERNIIRDRTMSGRKKRREQGRNAGQMYNYGYKPGGNGSWALDGWDEENQCFTGAAAVVRRIFEEFLSGAGANTVAANLNRDGVPSAKGKLWRSTTILQLLDKPAYKGTYTAGRFKKVSPGKYKKGQAALEKEGAIPPIVTPEMWERAQQLRSDRATAHPKTLSADNQYLLTGHMRCAKCGAPMTGHFARGIRYYRCAHTKEFKTCDAAMTKAETIEQALIAEVRQECSGDRLRFVAADIERKLRQDVLVKEEAHATAQTQVAALQRRRSKLDNDYFNEAIDGKTYSRLSERLDEEVREAEKRVVSTQEALLVARSTRVDLDRLHRLAERLDVLQELSRDELRLLLRELVAEVHTYRPSLGAGKSAPVELTWRPRLDLTTMEPADAAD